MWSRRLDEGFWGEQFSWLESKFDVQLRTGLDVAAGMGAGQAEAAQEVGEPVFEVASVRLSPPGGDGMTAIHLYEGPEVTIRSATLELLLELAFDVQEYQIAGLPKWADSATYDIEAKTGGTVALTYEQLKPLVQQLLAERLHLTVRREMKDLKGYALVVAKGGPKLQATKGAGRMAQILPNGVEAWKINLSGFAAMLGHATRRPVVDKTGIAGEYDFDLKYSPEGTEDSSLPSIFTALQEDLGLKLETQMVPVEMLVVEKVERVPVEN